MDPQNHGFSNHFRKPPFLILGVSDAVPCGPLRPAFCPGLPPAHGSHQ